MASQKTFRTYFNVKQVTLLKSTLFLVVKMNWSPRRLKGWLWQNMNISWVYYTRVNQNMLLWAFSLWDVLGEMFAWANNSRNTAHYNSLTECRFTELLKLLQTKDSFTKKAYLTLYNIYHKTGYATKRLMPSSWRWFWHKLFWYKFMALPPVELRWTYTCKPTEKVHLWTWFIRGLVFLEVASPQR